jgi:hypothetical protein
MAIQKREKIYFDKMRKNIFYMNRWNIVREKRKDIEEMEKLEERKRIFIFWWIRKCFTIKFLQSIFDQFDQHRNKILQGYKEKLFANRIFRNFQKMIVSKGPTLAERNINFIRHSNTAIIPVFLKEICENRCKHILTDYMKITSMNYEIKTVFISYYE